MEFIHLALQEYLTATYLADNMREEEKIVRFIEAGPAAETGIGQRTLANRICDKIR